MSEVIDINQGREEPKTVLDEIPGEGEIIEEPKMGADEMLKEPQTIVNDGQKEAEKDEMDKKLEEDFLKSFDVPNADPKEGALADQPTMKGISSSARNWYLALLAALGVGGGAAIYATRGTSDVDKAAIEELKNNFTGLDGRVVENKSAIADLEKDLDSEKTTRAGEDKRLAGGIVAETAERIAADSKLAKADKKLEDGLVKVNSRLTKHDADIGAISQGLEAAQVDMRKFAALQAEVIKLRSEFEAARGNLKPAEKAVLEGQLAMINEAIRTNQDIKKIEKQVANIKAAITEMVTALSN